MIRLTRFDKKELCINADMIKTVEATPDTIITLATGERLFVAESVDEVVARFIEYQCLIREQRARGVLEPPAPSPDDEAAIEHAASGSA